MNRRYFFKQLSSGLVAATAPGLFLPKLIKPGWKPTVFKCETYEDVLRRAIELRKKEILQTTLQYMRAVLIDGYDMSAASWIAASGKTFETVYGKSILKKRLGMSWPEP